MENLARKSILGCPVDDLDLDETLQEIEKMVESGSIHQHVVVNVDKLIKYHKDPELKRIINRCSLINVDGMPLLWASRLLGNPLKERVTGIDLFEKIFSLAAKKKWRLYFLGAMQEVVEIVVHLIKNQYKTIDICGYRNGYWTSEEEPYIVAKIRELQPHILFVGFSSPQKEFFLDRRLKDMAVPFVMGVGGSFDVLAGKTKRAPRWMQNIGLEWFYRFLQEPKRMFKRYFVDDIYFFWLFSKEFVYTRILKKKTR